MDFEQAYQSGIESLDYDPLKPWERDNLEFLLQESVELHNTPLAGYCAGRLSGYGNDMPADDQGFLSSY